MRSSARKQKTPTTTLRHVREQRGWSQEHVARAVGTNAFTVSRWETGASFPSPFYRVKLCQLFERSPVELGLIPSIVTDDLLVSPGTMSGARTPSIFDPAIPHPPSHTLVGREKLLARLEQTLRDKVAPCLALKGLPGVGKTALAIALAHNQNVRAEYAGGVLWAGLGDQANIANILSHWGKVLGLANTQTEKLTTTKAMTIALRREIGTRSMLIVLDDAWSLDTVIGLQIGGPRCTYLVTTRLTKVALQVAGNMTVVVRELSVSKGVTLLTQLAPASKSMPDDVQKLARVVGGLPLALILMGNYIQAEAHSLQQRRLVQAVERLSSAEERLRLMQPFDSMPGLSSVSVATSYSLQAVIDLSNRHLSPAARSALRLLAVFPPKPNTFREDAALAVCATSTNVLDELTDAGLVESQGQGYYTLHQTIADYAKTVNDISDEEREMAEKRMVTFFVQFVVAHCQHYDLLEREAKNIITVIELAYEQKNFSAFLRGVSAFAVFWIVRGQHSNAEKYLYLAQEIAEDKGDARHLAITGLHLARIAELSGEFTYADAIYEARLVAARQCNDVEIISALLIRWGELMIQRGEYRRVQPYMAECLGLTHKLRHKHLVAGLYKCLGEVAYAHGEYWDASSYYEKGLRLARVSEDHDTIAGLLQNMGAYAVLQRNYRLAHQRYEEGLFHANGIKDQERSSALLMHQGFLAGQERNYQLAEKLLYESLELAYESKSRSRMAAVLQNLGIIETMQYHYGYATQYFNASYEIACDIEHVGIASETLYGWGELHLKRNEWGYAEDKFKRVLKVARAMEMPELIAKALFGLARVVAGRLQGEQARLWGRESFLLYAKMKHPSAGDVEAWLGALPADRK